MDITTVQRWILAGMLGSFGLSLAASLSYSAILMMDRDKVGNSWGLWAMGVIVGLLVMGGTRLIHERSPLSWWLLLGLVPAVPGAYFLL